MNKIIICDECSAENCIVVEIFPKSTKVTMKDFAKQRKNPYSLNQYQAENRNRTWEIRCSVCGYSLTYIEYAVNQWPPSYNVKRLLKEYE